MVFSSLLFLFAFLPAALIGTYLAPRRARNTVLLAFSIFFYAWSEPRYLLLMLFALISAYLFAFPIDRLRKSGHFKRARWLSGISVSVNLSLLFFFKYYNFFAKNLSRLPAVELPVLVRLVLPIGISFYTFQIISYTVDLCRGECALQESLIDFGAYVTLFPQLVAGPIVRYSEIDQQLRERHTSVSDFSSGVSRFCVGLAKKVLLGDVLASGSDYFSRLGELSPSTLGAWMTVLLYTLHLYFDFSGYSDMAIGLGRMLGFRFPENFNYPYISRSITEFWRRWHMTLSAWFREYVYIPLGGNRRGGVRQYCNLCVVWLLTGFWHGADWNFLLWGAYFAVLLILEKAFLLRVLERTPSLLRHFYTMLLVMLGFLIFSTPDLTRAWAIFSAMLGFGAPLTNASASYETVRLLPILLIAAIGSTPLPRRLWEKLRFRTALVPVLSASLLLLCTAYLVDSSFSPFAYTQF